jgi:SNF2-related domain
VAAIALDAVSAGGTRKDSNDLLRRERNSRGKRFVAVESGRHYLNAIVFRYPVEKFRLRCRFLAMSKELPIGEQVLLPGHFDGPVTLEAARALTSGFECRVRLPDGTLEEAVLSEEEATALGKISTDGTTPAVANAEDIRLLVESTRIRLAYAHDKHFAVSLSGIQTFPHQIEAVYLKMLPQPRLRFLLADDPGTGKTIMAGLLIKEMKLREAIERVLILCPSPLTIQWQDEMLRWYFHARARTRGLQASGRLSSLHSFGYAKNRTAYRFRDKSVLRSLTRASDQSPIATAVRAVFTDMPPGKYADT